MAGAKGGGGAGFGEHLADTGRSIVAEARRALADPTATEAERVHELRKAFKRWRAWLRLMGAPIGAPAEAMRAEARALMRGLSGARDAQSALDAVDDLARRTDGLSARTLASIRSRLTARRDAAETASLTPQARAGIARHLDAAEAALATWPVAEVGFGIIADSLVATFRRARQLAPDDWAEADPAQLHELRQRVVEHRHQMELVEPLWPRLTRAWANEAQRLRNRLGACQDLAVLERLVAPHQPLARWRSQLVPLIAARRRAHLKAAARLAGRLFAERPKAFRAHLDALWTARKRRRVPT
jgi:CHAD domain-containing protein